MKKRKSLFSWLTVICLVVAAFALVAYAMNVNTLIKMQSQYAIATTYSVVQTQPFVKTAMTLNMDQTDQGLATLTARGQFTRQFTPFAVAEVPEPYNNLILISVSIKGKGTQADLDTKNTYLLKTVMVENHGGLGTIPPQLVTNQKTLKI